MVAGNVHDAPDGIWYPYNVAFNAHNYDFATEYQNVIIEVLGEDVWQTEF